MIGNIWPLTLDRRNGKSGPEERRWWLRVVGIHPADQLKFKEGRDDMLHVFRDDALNEKVSGEARPEKKLQAQILAEMMAIDRTRAVTTMKAWAKFVELASRTRSEPFETLEEYLPSRAIDAGELYVSTFVILWPERTIDRQADMSRFWYGMLTFALALTIPAEELDLCMKLARPGYAAISLTNDLYSWRKEREDAKKAGQDYVFNAVWVVMQERKCSEYAAIEICRREIKRHFTEFEKSITSPETKALSRDTQAYLQAVKLSHVGNLVWSIYCPRYQRDVYVTPIPHASTKKLIAFSDQITAPSASSGMVIRLLDTIVKYLISPFQHFFQLSQRRILIQKLVRLVS